MHNRGAYFEAGRILPPPWAICVGVIPLTVQDLSGQLASE
jgi:hypothetical protein